MKNRTIAITGGGQGIGKAIVFYFLKEGFNVSVIDTDSSSLEELKDFDTKKLLTFCGDVSVEKDVFEWVKLTINKFERVNILVNNAAIAINKPIIDLSYEEWQKVINVNLGSIFLTSKYFYPHLSRTEGSIINLASTRAFQSEKNTEAYSASKGGVVSITHALAISLGPSVRVNCISPGWIDTTEWRKKSDKKVYSLREEDHLQHPAGRVGKPEDIVNMIKFLSSEENSFVTGANFIIDGGMTKKMIYIE
ncbi:MAG: SDR family oxidoreductase [Brevinematales bacterium]|nr:SDR family oxidoreductase [Brevinematales bacterium]